MGDINVTPLVDVMLVLLIIFMVTAPAMLQELSVDLPKSTVGQAQAAEGVVITLRRDGDVELNRETVPLAELGPRLSALRTRQGERPVFLRADEQVPYGRVVDTVGRIKAVGIDQLGLVVELVGAGASR